uniref:uncharacterized protein LOC127061980 n=1 Tax=Vespula vulgaris TaxID=7454 RepID=UPI00223C2124|nr:uncharacterized protein LOC127061980 [Vespula vulgaris]
MLKNMLTTTIDSPQHKRILRIRNNRKNNSPSSDIHRTDKSNEDVITIKKSKEIHLELIKCARKINDAYGLHILLSILINILDVLLCVQDHHCKPRMCRNCHRVCHISLHATNIGDILCELYEPSTSNEFCAEIRDFTLQLIQNPLSFTICGFFDLDYTLIRNVIATVTTYLVILIQIGNVPIEFFFENIALSTNNSGKIYD